MNKVWVVSEGEYSDWRILGIYSTKELAIEAKIRAGTGNDVDEHVIDALPARPDGEYKWTFTFNENGDLKRWETGGDFPGRRGATKYRHGILDVFALGETFDEALKSATDTRRMALAMNPQPETYRFMQFD